MTDEDLQVEIEVWPCHWKTLLLFNAMSTQWRDGGMDYAVLPFVARRLDIRLSRKRFATLQLMEGEALRVQAERRKSKTS